jgi:tetratricopeptide (TPR) repeat protein
LDEADLNKAEIHLKLIRSLAAAGKHEEVVRHAQDLLTTSPNAAEARFLFAVSLQHLGQKQEALRQVLLLLESPDATAWKECVGNQIGNQLYNQGDYPNALVIYRQLSQADTAPEWQIPMFYQIGLVYERMHQPEQAAVAYTSALDRGAPLGGNAAPSLQTVLDMAAWRKNYLAWQTQAQQANQALHLTPSLNPTR